MTDYSKVKNVNVNPLVVMDCLEFLEKHYDWAKWDLILDPFVETFGFFDLIPVHNKVGFDKFSERQEDSQEFFNNVYKEDFLENDLSSFLFYQNVLTLGRVPLGGRNKIATDYFNHAAVISKTIAFIMPRIFQFNIRQKYLDQHFYLIHQMDIPIDSHTFSPFTPEFFCFQIWEYSDIRRFHVSKRSKEHKDWVFLEPSIVNKKIYIPEDVDFVIRTMTRCGEIVTDNLKALHRKSGLWIKANINKNTLIERFRALDYSCFGNCKALTKYRLVKLYSDQFD